MNIQFYIFKNDDIGTKILNILEEKAKAGVEVRLLYDSVGSRLLNKDVLKSLRDVGGKTGEFFPSWLKFININMNFRNHRKIVVIDDKIGFVGGFNVGDEYLGKDKKFGYWRDTHIKFKGSAVKDLNLRFLADWRYATKEDVDLTQVLEVSDESIGEPNTGMQIVSSGPNLSERYEIKLAYLKMIQKAKRYLYIQSPYLIIDKTISDSLKLASASGVDVKIMIPGKGDHPFVYWANLVNAGELLEYGIKIYHYDKTAFLHAKTVVIDDEICSIGTANMDTRSYELNFEVNAFIYSKGISKKQKAEFEKDMLKCEELTLEKYKNRGRVVRIKESISRLFSDVL
ncbi:cardiolipin synthase [uncultured Clostridium sp.]|uniref:cardiolipin synthase n=1 Tax=uncultured Clostridium sp. TaxID=59620 RepID=UPI00351EE306